MRLRFLFAFAFYYGTGEDCHVIRMNDVTVVYDNGIRAVNKASLRVDEGEFVFLVGASGSGKTTIIKLLTAEVRLTEGRVLVNNYNIGEMKKRQIPYLRRHAGRGVSGFPPDQDQDRV